ncbi:MAG TPA: hypothetical protein PJ988_05010 [Anaerolinea sp.]|nr:hypothetical protein [Anaerolinea sp.]
MSKSAPAWARRSIQALSWGGKGPPRRIAGEDLYRLPAEGWAGVDPGVHLHDGRAGDGVPVQDGGLDGGGSAPARQQRGMHIDAAVAWQVQHVLAQDLAESGHHDQVGGPAVQFLLGIGQAQPFRLDDLQA